MQALIKKNKGLRVNFKNLELESYINSAIIKNQILLTSEVGNYSVTARSSKGAISKIRNICVLTGRARAVIQEYKLSRIKFKQNAESGRIPGLKKL